MLNDLLCKYQTPKPQGAIPAPVSKKPAEKVQVWGDYNFSFRFSTQGESLYQTSKLSALTLQASCSLLRRAHQACPSRCAARGSASRTTSALTRSRG